MKEKKKKGTKRLYEIESLKLILLNYCATTTKENHTFMERERGDGFKDPSDILAWTSFNNFTCMMQEKLGTLS